MSGRQSFPLHPFRCSTHLNLPKLLFNTMTIFPNKQKVLANSQYWVVVEVGPSYR